MQGKKVGGRSMRAGGQGCMEFLVKGSRVELVRTNNTIMRVPDLIGTE
jgi:hypothetical protein